MSEVNIQLFRAINDLGKVYPQYNPAMFFIAEYLVLLLALATIGYWCTRKQSNRMMVLCGGLSFVVAEIIAKIAGMIHFNQQPFAELSNVNQLVFKPIDNSFPSDHTIIFFSFCITFWLFKKRWGILWVLLASIVGISRIWVGVHYPADVFAGMIISLFSAVLVYYLFPRLKMAQKILTIYEKGEQAALTPFGKGKKSKSKDM